MKVIRDVQVFETVLARARREFASTSAEKIEDAVEFFLKQPPGCEAGEIALFDRNERRVIGSVKWKVESTENGLRVPHRHNLFCDWNTALVALDFQRSSEQGLPAGPCFLWHSEYSAAWNGRKSAHLVAGAFAMRQIMPASRNE